MPNIFNLPPALATQIHEVGDSILGWFHPAWPLPPITADWPLVAFEDAAVVTGLYLVFVLFGYIIKISSSPAPKQAKASSKGKSIAAIFAGEPVLIFMSMYNITQVALCGYMMYEAVRQQQSRKMKLICNAVDYTETGLASVLWVFYCSKVLDFFDTIFMVVRGKWAQFSILHTYHHASIFIVYWLLVNVGHDGDIFFTVALNSFVHFVMYFYYFVSTLGYTVPKPIKMAITKMQMIQFVMMNLQGLYILFMGCPGPDQDSREDDMDNGGRIYILYLAYIVSMFMLFNDFRKKAYTKLDGKKKE